MNKLIYNYDKYTYEFINSSVAMINPKNKSKILIPLYATDKIPPTINEKNKTIRFNTELNDWEIVDDYRGVRLYKICIDKNNESYKYGMFVDTEKIDKIGFTPYEYIHRNKEYYDICHECNYILTDKEPNEKYHYVTHYEENHKWDFEKEEWYIPVELLIKDLIDYNTKKWYFIEECTLAITDSRINKLDMLMDTMIYTTNSNWIRCGAEKIYGRKNLLSCALYESGEITSFTYEDIYSFHLMALDIKYRIRNLLFEYEMYIKQNCKDYESYVDIYHNLEENYRKNTKIFYDKLYNTKKEWD